MMAKKEWQVVKVRYCDHSGCEVSLETEVVFPADFMPEQLPRVTGHRCSHGRLCMIDNNLACIYSGGNPTYDPFND
jgi:hypothetical protein